MGRKKQKPVAKCTFLFPRATVGGWGELSDAGQVQDYGEANWEPDPDFQSQCRLPYQPPRRAFAQPRRVVTPPPTPTPSRAITRKHRRDHICTLVFLVPPRLQFVCTTECRSLWPDCHSSSGDSHGKVYTSVRHLHDIPKALDMRSALGCRIQMMESHDLFSGWANRQRLVQEVQNEATRLSWIVPLQAWALLSENGSRYDPSIDLECWFPPPSFRVHCETPNGDTIVNYGEICEAFARGIHQTFQRWRQNETSPDIDIILEIQDENVAILIDVRPCCIVSPFCDPPRPLNDPAVAHSLLHIINVQPGEILLNCTCSSIDVVEELFQASPGIAHAIVCDQDQKAVCDSLDAATQWSEMNNGDGSVCDVTQLPFRDGSVDVVVAMMCVTPGGRSTNPSRLFSKRLQEMARVCRVSTGRVCFLTNQDDIIVGLLNKRVNWSTVQKFSTAFGRFTCTLYLLQRSARPFPQVSPGLIATPGFDNLRRSRGRGYGNASSPIPPGMGPSPRPQSPSVYTPLSLCQESREEMEWDDYI